MLLAAGLVPRSRFCRRRCEFGSLEEGVPGSEEVVMVHIAFALWYWQKDIDTTVRTC